MEQAAISTSVATSEPRVAVLWMLRSLLPNGSTEFDYRNDSASRQDAYTEVCAQSMVLQSGNERDLG
jgi:hypothetical protein